MCAVVSLSSQAGDPRFDRASHASAPTASTRGTERASVAGAPRPGRLAVEQLDDERLAQLARTGDERAFQALMERHRAALLAYCRSIVDDAGAPDAVQQTFISAWYALLRGCEVRSVRPWLFTIARHAALQLRMQARRTDQLPALLAGGRTPEEQFELSRRARSALAAVAGLPSNERHALVETSIRGRSGSELAEALGLSETAARQLIFRARARARAAFGAWAPLPLLARLSSSAGRAARRGLILARQHVVGAGSIEADNPLLRLAPVFVSGVLVAAPVAAIELTRDRRPQVPASHALAGRRPQARPSVLWRPRVAVAARIGRGGLHAAPGSPTHKRGGVRTDVFAPAGGSGRTSQSGASASEPVQLLPGHELPIELASAGPGAIAPSTTHALIRSVLKATGTAGAKGVARAAEQLTPAGGGATALVGGLGRQALERSEASAASAVASAGSPANPQTVPTLP